MELQLNREICVRFHAPRRWYDRAKWELLEEYTSANGRINVPVGFVSDGASIVWILRWLLSPTGRHFGAAIVHDYILCSEHDWKKANREFKEELEELGVPSWTRFVMVNAVRLYSLFK